MTLRIQNNQGATQEYRNVENETAAREIIKSWSDPENLKTTLIDDGKFVWDSIPANEA